MTQFFLDQKPQFQIKKYSSLTPFLSQFVLCLTFYNSTSQNVGGRMHGPSPPQFVWGTVAQSSPKSPPIASSLFSDTDMRNINVETGLNRKRLPYDSVMSSSLSD